MTSTRPAVFIDRDGVVNALVERDGAKVSPRRFEEFSLLPGVEEAIRKIQDLGYLCIIVTNQPDISRGLMALEELEKMNKFLERGLQNIVVRICPHQDSDNCNCRKPKPGLLTTAISEFGIDTSVSWMIGDRMSDLQAGQAAGCRLAFIQNGQDLVIHDEFSENVIHSQSLQDFSNYLREIAS